MTQDGHDALPGQIVLVLQGGGALGAFQVGVYEAMHEAGIEPDWVIGTSIGAINGAIIAGNRAEDRMARLTAFWETVCTDSPAAIPWWPDAGNAMANLGVFMRGVPGFFEPNPQALWGMRTRLGVERASYYDTAALRATLLGLVDFGRLKEKQVRLSLGAVGVAHGEMRYFDSRDTDLGLDHVMASGALPPACWSRCRRPNRALPRRGSPERQAAARRRPSRVPGTAPLPGCRSSASHRCAR